MKVLVFLILVLLANSVTIDEKFQEVLKDEDILGLSVAIIVEGKVVYENAFGLRDYERALPM
jgi:CubicO group peptidase (beta-lactamase class C family)